MNDFDWVQYVSLGLKLCVATALTCVAILTWFSCTVAIALGYMVAKDRWRSWSRVRNQKCNTLPLPSDRINLGCDHFAMEALDSR